jgi:hypothetical protein
VLQKTERPVLGPASQGWRRHSASYWSPSSPRQPHSPLGRIVVKKYAGSIAVPNYLPNAAFCPTGQSVPGAQSRRSSSQAETQKTSPLDWSWKLIWGARLRDVMAEPTGRSSQIFPVAMGRNAQFVATVARSILVRQVCVCSVEAKAASLMCEDAEASFRLQRAEIIPVHKKNQQHGR